MEVGSEEAITQDLRSIPGESYIIVSPSSNGFILAVVGHGARFLTETPVGRVIPPGEISFLKKIRITIIYQR